MKRKRFSEEQIIAILREHETNVPTADLCRKHVMSRTSLYTWKQALIARPAVEAPDERVLLRLAVLM